MEIKFKKKILFETIIRTARPKFEEFSGLIGVFIIGSYAQVLNDSKSDLDLYFIFDAKHPNKNHRQAFYKKAFPENRLTLKKENAGWSATWAAVTDEIEVNRCKVEISYASYPWLSDLVKKVRRRGAISLPGFEFRPYTVLGLLDRALIVYDPHKKMEGVQKSIYPYPRRLKKNILRSKVPILIEIVSEIQECIDRKLGNGVLIFHLSRFEDCLSTILFAVNDTFDPASKRNEYFVSELKSLPKAFDGFMKCLEGPYNSKGRRRLRVKIKQIERQTLNLVEIDKTRSG